jgi:hypothetical protein
MGIFDELEIRTLLPDLHGGKFKVTSPVDVRYNCIAFAAGDTTKWWWPDPQYYWPSSIRSENTLEAYIMLFKSLGYEECAGPEVEPGFEKVAIFTGATGKPTHAARQLETGVWASKLGKSFDIQHELEQVGGFKAKSYGRLAAYLKRPTKAGSI